MNGVRRATGLGWPAQFLDLFLIQLTNWRWSWRQQLFLGVLFPTTGLLLLSTVAGENSSSSDRGYLVAGSVLMSVALQNQNLVASNFAFMKANGTDVYFRTLPITVPLLPVATLTSFAVLALPAALVAVAVAPQATDVALDTDLVLVPILALTAAVVSYLGALIALRTRTAPEASSLSFAVSLVLVSTGGVYFPTAELPTGLRAVSAVNPLTFAARAVRAALLAATEDASVVLDTGLLAIWVVALAAAVHVSMRSGYSRLRRWPSTSTGAAPATTCSNSAAR